MTDGPQYPFQQHPQQPQQQAQPSWNAEPDWEALADESESQARRKKLLMIGGGVLAVAAIGGIVATAVVSADKKGPGPSPTATAVAPAPSLPPESVEPSVAAPSPENPLDILSDAEKDSAPLSALSLFPAKNLNRAGREYTRTNTAATSSCSSAAASSLATALGSGNCRQVFRATYVRDQMAVTIGVAVFANKAQADKVKGTTQYIRPLNGGGVNDFCHAVSCLMTANSVGRYAYFTISGLKTNQSLTTAAAAKQAGSDISTVTFELLVQRGRAEANARLTASPAS